MGAIISYIGGPVVTVLVIWAIVELFKGFSGPAKKAGKATGTGIGGVVNFFKKKAAQGVETKDRERNLLNMMEAEGGELDKLKAHLSTIKDKMATATHVDFAQLRADAGMIDQAIKHYLEVIRGSSILEQDITDRIKEIEQGEMQIREKINQEKISLNNEKANPATTPARKTEIDNFIDELDKDAKSLDNSHKKIGRVKKDHKFALKETQKIVTKAQKLEQALRDYHYGLDHQDAAGTNKAIQGMIDAIDDAKNELGRVMAAFQREAQDLENEFRTIDASVNGILASIHGP